MNNQSTEQHWQVLVLLLKNIAAEKGITREQISDKTGMKASSISRIFSLRYRVTLANYVSIAQAIGVNLFIDDKDSKAVEDAEEALGKEQEQGDMTEDEFDNKTECLFNKPTTEQPSIELSEEDKIEVFSRDECIFKYCPHPELCKDECQSKASTLNDKINKDNL